VRKRVGLVAAGLVLASLSSCRERRRLRKVLGRVGKSWKAVDLVKASARSCTGRAFNGDSLKWDEWRVASSLMKYRSQGGHPVPWPQAGMTNGSCWPPSPADGARRASIRRLRLSYGFFFAGQAPLSLGTYTSTRSIFRSMTSCRVSAGSCSTRTKTYLLPQDST
jgi:hypothetical protein